MRKAHWPVSIFIVILSICNSHCWSWNWQELQEKVLDIGLCSFGECCRKIDIPADFNGLEKALKEKVYGQHLVHSIVDALRGHWEYSNSKKPLTISFHGWPGGGKNYVATFIANYLYKKGTKSKYVHWFIGRIHFPKEDLVEKYQEELYQLIKSETSKCPKQLFVFDEVDKIPANVLNAIKNVIDYRDNVEGVDYRQCIFIFLSNTGQDLINTKYLESWKLGTIREDLKLSEFETLILKGAFTEKGGFHLSDTIKSNLIDHYIPFLPMALQHVRLCILDEFANRGVDSPKEEHVKEILEIFDWAPDRERLFAKTGCKRVSQKVGMLVAQHYRHLRKAEL